MQQIIIRNKDGTDEEILDMPDYIFDEVMKLIKDKHGEYLRNKIEGNLPCLFG